MEWVAGSTMLSNVLALLKELTTPNTELQKKIYSVLILYLLI
jgi:hypothetical protein